MTTASTGRDDSTNQGPDILDLTAERISSAETPAQDDSDTSADVDAAQTADTPVTPEPDLQAPEERKAEEQPAYSVPPVAERSSGGGLGAIAAGIFGGLVALVGAGSVQYAGYIPNLGPAAAVQPAADPALAADVEALKAQLQALEAKPQASADLSAIEDRLAKLEAFAAKPPVAVSSGDGAATAEMQTAIQDANGKVNELSQQVLLLKSALESTKAEVEKAADNGGVARSIAVAALKAAVDRGGSFAPELDTIKGLDANDPLVKELGDAASAGVVSRAELVRSFPAMADAVFAALNQIDPQAGIAERLMQSALSVVKVRPVGNVEGSAPEDILARADEKLKNGDLKGVAGELATLPEAAKPAVADYAAKLGTRIKIEDAINASLSPAAAPASSTN